MLQRALSPSRPSRWQAWLRAWPGQCALCHAHTRQGVCDACLERYASHSPRCTGCALPLPAASSARLHCGACLRLQQGGPPALDGCVAALDYGFPWDRLLQQFKFSQRLEWADLLVDRLDAALDTTPAPAPDWLLPVPLAEGRLRERGYNQSWELTRRLARRRGLRSDARLLLRTRDTPHQIDLPAEQRQANVRGAFAIDPLRLKAVQGCQVAVVDDVMTTGATLREIARVLKSAGAVHVQAWVVARTDTP